MIVSPKIAVGVLVFSLGILFIFIGPSTAEDQFAIERHQMIEQDIKERGIKDSVVLDVMGKVPRHMFVDHHTEIGHMEIILCRLGKGRRSHSPTWLRS